MHASHFRLWLIEYHNGSIPYGALSQFARQHGINYSVVYRASKGRAIGFEHAKRLSTITGGAVSIEQLCCPEKIDIGMSLLLA